MSNTFYLSKKGNDKNNGGKSAPLRSFSAVLEKTRALDGEKTVIIEAGRYLFRETLELDARDNNTHFIADGEVYFDGGIILDNSKIEDYRDGIKKIDLSYLGIELHGLGNRGFRRAYINAPTEFFVGGVAQKIARYPKNGVINYEEKDIVDCGSTPIDGDYACRPAVLRLDGEKIKKWAGAKHAYLGGYPKHAWADECVKIAKIDAENGTVTTEQPHLFGYQFTHHSGYYVVNLLEELTDEGEYYIDIDENVLYFKPSADVDLETATLQISVMDKVMVAIENAENVSFEGITFENTRNSGVYIEGGDGCTVKNCVFRNMGILAVQIGQGATPLEHGLNDCHGAHSPLAKPFKPLSREMGSWHEYIYEFAAWDNNGGKNHSVEGCKIYDCGAGGILLGGGNRKSLTPANNRVHNCEFWSTNRLDKTYKGAVNMMGVGNTVSHCYMHDLPAFAIYLHGNDHTIEFNDITRVCIETSDSGAIYMGRDMSEVGNVFRNNYIHDLENTIETGLGVCAIYFDDWDIFNAVYDNFFVNIKGGGFCVIHHTCGGLLSFHNNFIVDCVPGIQPDNKSNSYIYMHRDLLAMKRVHTVDENDLGGVDVTSPIWREKYPYLYETYKNDYRPEWMYYNNALLYHKYDCFVDARNGDFTQIDGFREKFYRDEYDWQRRTDVIMGYENDLVHPHRVDFKSIGLIKK
ncbi:MAG: right-handed parallel beta-helix repeat-containing protein [Clostridia bacterium]|nr:right-handed parallel beta-helix repeat-containing protein [Clostridia bacterium]